VTDASGDILWGWQEADELTPEQLRARAPELMVLIHRDPKVARTWRTYAMAHRDRFGFTVRLARFDLALVAEQIEGREQ
jgi:hypothetical protein